jgi:hypothetical protein
MSSLHHESIPAHCGKGKCAEKLTALCACKCDLCSESNAVFTEAATLEHCGQGSCLQRLKAGSQIPYPACPCGCEKCDAVAVKAGLRPPSKVVAVTTSTDLDFADLVDEPVVVLPPGTDLDFLEIPEDPSGTEPTTIVDVDNGIVKAIAGNVCGGEFASAPIVLAAINELDEITGRGMAEVMREGFEKARQEGPPITGSKSSLFSNCMYWSRPDVERVREDTSDDAAFGTVGHTYAEEYAKGKMTPAREAQILEMIPEKSRDRMSVCMIHVRRWLDEHKGLFRRAEVPVAFDAEAMKGVELGPALKELGLEGQRSYSNPETWYLLRQKLGLGMLSVPMTVDLVRIEEGSLIVYDWCFGRTDKVRQLALGALCMSSIHNVWSATGVALYVDEDGVREVSKTLNAEELNAVGDELLELLKAAPTSSPNVGMHCTGDHCPARDACPEVQNAIETVTNPLATTGHRFTPNITDIHHAEWLLPRWRLLKDAAEQVGKALAVFCDTKAPNGIIPTGPGKCWTKIEKKGSLSFNRAHAEALLKTLGATDEQIAECYKQGAPRVEHREKNIPKELKS